MNREALFDNISKLLIAYSYQVELEGKINCTSIHVHGEVFIRDLLNLVYGVELALFPSPYQEGFDMIDEHIRLLVQVSSRHDKAKIDSSFSSKTAQEHAGYHLVFFCFGYWNRKSGPGSINLKMADWPDGVETAILSVNDLLTFIKDLPIDKLLSVNELVSKELTQINESKMPSCLAYLVGEFDKKDSLSRTPKASLPFEIKEKIHLNGLADMEGKIGDYAAYQSILGDLYDTYLSQGKNLKRKVLEYLSDYYLQESQRNAGISLFYAIVSRMEKEIVDSSNCPLSLTKEDLRHGCMAIAVDAFIRCRIFKNPMGGNPQ